MTVIVLVALDINDPVEAARIAATARLVAQMEGAELHALNVVPDSGMSLVGSYLGPEHAGKMMQAAKDGLAAFATEHLPDLGSGQLHVLQGAIYDEILKAIRSMEPVTVVIGAHRPELRDYLIGPNAARVARHATCSVFIVR